MTVLRLTIALLAALWPATAGAADDSYRLDGSQIFTLFFVTLGPLKILGPFAQLTRGGTPEQIRRLAWRAAAIASFTLIAGGFLGRALLGGWGIPIAVLELTAGILFFLVASRAVLAPYLHDDDSLPAAPPSETLPSPLAVAFPLVVTPYGMAAVITLLALSHGVERTGLVLVVLLVVMLANLAAMVWIRRLMRPATVAALQVLGAVLGILQVALALWILLAGVQRLASS